MALHISTISLEMYFLQYERDSTATYVWQPYAKENIGRHLKTPSGFQTSTFATQMPDHKLGNADAKTCLKEKFECMFNNM